MAKFEMGSDPANHTVAEVMEFLTGEDCTPDEYDRVIQAEREGKARVGIVSGSGVETTSEPVAPPEVDPDPVDGPRQQQREIEAEASAAGTDRALTKAQLAALPVDVQAGLTPKTYTPAEAVVAATEIAHAWARPNAAAVQE